MTAHKTNLSKFNIEFLLGIFFLPQWYEAKVNNIRKDGKYTNKWQLNDMLLDKQWVKKQIQRKIKKYLETNEGHIWG